MIDDAIETMHDIRHAIADFANVFGDRLTASGVGPHMTCMEAEVFADVLRLVSDSAADTFLAGHAEGDSEPGDMHGLDHGGTLTYPVKEG